MSYSQQVKREIMEITGITELEMLGEVRTVILSRGKIENKEIEIKLDNITMASRLYGILQELTNMKIVIKYSISKKFGEHKVYSVSIPYQRGYKEFIKKLNETTTSMIISNEEILKGAIRGYFLYSGYLKDPEKEYAMDFFIDSEEAADELFNLLQALDKKVARATKKNKNLVYLRNSEDIMDIMVMMGSMRAFFKFEETTMIKDLKNKTIREMNWEVANETKTINSAYKQIKMIEYIEEVYGLNNLTPVLKEIAEYRLKYQESSFQEIADLIGISKSGIKNRFRRLEEFYSQLVEEEGIK